MRWYEWVTFYGSEGEDTTLCYQTGQVKNNLSVDCVDHASSNDSKEDRYTIISIADVLFSNLPCGLFIWNTVPFQKITLYINRMT